MFIYTHFMHFSLFYYHIFQPKLALQTLPALCHSLPCKHKIQPHCSTPFPCYIPSIFRSPLLYLLHVRTLYLASSLFQSEGRAGIMGTFRVVNFLFFSVRINVVPLIKPQASVIFFLCQSAIVTSCITQREVQHFSKFTRYSVPGIIMSNSNGFGVIKF